MHTMRSVELVDTNCLSMGVWYKTQERGETLLPAARYQCRRKCARLRHNVLLDFYVCIFVYPIRHTYMYAKITDDVYIYI